ncbi:MAG: tetratricopeptide repeat protein [Candidatus Thorarchaeota archaeon]|nr:tetratricopeptide repeat protein [Candidatus Thorarchaeota archaeon]
MVRETRNSKASSDMSPSEDTPAGWFRRGCSLAMNGKPNEAERALKIAVDMQEVYPLAWAILAALLLSQGRETDAEKTGKVALEQCKDLKMTWPKLRSIMHSHAIIKRKDWKSPSRIKIDAAEDTEWGSILAKLNAISNDSLDTIDHTEEDALVKQDEKGTEPVPSEDQSQVRTKRKEAGNLGKTQADDANAEVWIEAANAHFIAGRFRDSESAYRKVLSIDPKNGRAQLRIGILLMKREELGKAENALRLATKYIPDNDDAWLQLGICLEKEKKFDESTYFLKTATTKNPRNVEAWVKLGKSDFSRSLYEEAARSFLRALRIQPAHEQALFYLGRCMEYRGNKNHALRVYRKLLSLKPEDPEILEELAKSFHRLGETQSANRAKGLAAAQRRSIK